MLGGFGKTSGRQVPPEDPQRFTWNRKRVAAEQRHERRAVGMTVCEDAASPEERGQCSFVHHLHHIFRPPIPRAAQMDGLHKTAKPERVARGCASRLAVVLDAALPHAHEGCPAVDGTRIIRSVDNERDGRSPA